jgi:hypothetical protein
MHLATVAERNPLGRLQRQKPSSPAGFVAVILRAWRRMNDRRTYKYFRDLLAFRNAGDPVTMLKSICPGETDLLDPSIKARVKFRLGGSTWPPIILYKVFIRGPLCDVNSFAPRSYYNDNRVVRAGVSFPDFAGHEGRHVPTQQLRSNLGSIGKLAMAGAASQPRFDSSQSRVSGGVRVGKSVFGLTAAQPRGAAQASNRGSRAVSGNNNFVLFGVTSDQLDKTARPPTLLKPSAALSHATGRTSVPAATAAFGRAGSKSSMSRNSGGFSASLSASNDFGATTTVDRFETRYLSRKYANTSDAVVLQSADDLVPLNWYRRCDGELNGWRPVAAQVVEEADQDPRLRKRKELIQRYMTPDLGPSKRQAALQAKRSRRRWLLSLYTSGLAEDANAVDDTAGYTQPELQSPFGYEEQSVDSPAPDLDEHLNHLLSAMGVEIVADLSRDRQVGGNAGAAGDADRASDAMSVSTSASTSIGFTAPWSAPVDLPPDEIDALLQGSAGARDYMDGQTLARTRQATLHQREEQHLHDLAKDVRWKNAVDFDAYRKMWADIGSSKRPV